MVEAMMALTLVDHIMMQKAQCELFENTLPNRPNPLGKTAKGEKRPVQHQGSVNNSRSVSQRVDEE